MKKIYLLLSAVMLGASVNAQVLPNAGFEAWRVGSAGNGINNLPVYAPVSWFGTDSLIIGAGQTLGFAVYGINPTVWQQQMFKDSGVNAHGGSYSARLVTKDQDTLGVVPGVLTNAEPSLNLATFSISFSGGQSTTLRTNSVSAWVKYTPTATTDSGSLLVQAYGDIGGNPDSLIGTGYVKIGALTNFTQVTANVVYANPDLIVNNVRISFASSADTNASVNSTLWVDDVTMVGVPQAVGSITGNSNIVNVYPNPATATLNLDGVQNISLVCNLMSVNGQVVATKTFSGKGSIDLTELASGLYFYTIVENGNIVQRGKVNIAK